MHDETTPVFVISVAAELTGLHAQTLRQYDRVGLVSPGRTPAGGRRYSLRDVAELREVARLSALGIGLEGVRRILELENQVTALQQRVAELQAEVDSFRAAERRTSLVVWRPQPRTALTPLPPACRNRSCTNRRGPVTAGQRHESFIDHAVTAITEGHTMDANQLTTKGQEAFAAAQRRALREGNPAVEPEHLLWAVLPRTTRHRRTGARRGRCRPRRPASRMPTRPSPTCPARAARR